MGRGRGQGQLKEVSALDSKKVRKKTTLIEEKLDSLYSSFEKRLSGLESLYEIAGDRVPVHVLPPDFYKDWPTNTPLEKFFLSYDRSRLDRALGLTMMSINKAFANKEISEADYKKAST